MRHSTEPPADGQVAGIVRLAVIITITVLLREYQIRSVPPKPAADTVVRTDPVGRASEDH